MDNDIVDILCVCCFSFCAGGAASDNNSIRGIERSVTIVVIIIAIILDGNSHHGSMATMIMVLIYHIRVDDLVPNKESAICNILRYTVSGYASTLEHMHFLMKEHSFILHQRHCLYAINVFHCIFYTLIDNHQLTMFAP